eukprot:CAMPEP_0197527730 /NCGR_PEP_ID=MMETSP1318-20131121/22631_1 /TAXON_ID=552666 /ORGANISM="Partenskyella glossopodia, Strain RCC365" /LENGTH=436 /DNA_ID=CAMNT_0043082517 /DNA_START=133 /DNA_END=1443 /DNA_ORIENTATION=+
MVVSQESAAIACRENVEVKGLIKSVGRMSLDGVVQNVKKGSNKLSTSSSISISYGELKCHFSSTSSSSSSSLPCGNGGIESKLEAEREVKCREAGRKAPRLGSNRISKIDESQKLKDFQRQVLDYPSLQGDQPELSSLDKDDDGIRKSQQGQGQGNDLTGYIVNETLCQTVMGCVKRCLRISDGLECILKVSRINRGRLRDCTIEDPSNEVRLLKQLGSEGKWHKNIARLIETVERPTCVWAVMEYANSGELFAMIEDQGSIIENDAKNIMKQCADAVAFMHSMGVAHLDLSLENILVHETFDGQIVPKIIDFGMAQEICTLHDASSSRPGKPSYMAPEIHAGETFDPQKADAFSLGVVLFTMLTGVPPFRLASPHDQRFSFVVGDSDRLERICKRWDRQISSSAARFLSKLIAYENERMNVKEMNSTSYLQGLEA